ncbi:MAG TPA: MOSC and FAD-binding oxidoreductase domain-containing protein [Solirubrobacteraceae bacterium]|jgi:ferredoxin-NADP reductase/MOSC domain-containing protein YiiM|nr:MOSC and FAD-binding oxidoreductase domain-containing protein [Solirubrobacteraceae bacterium]
MTAGRLVSLNVGGPRDVPWEGKTVRTAIWKDPVDGPRMVRRINIDGDDQADRAAHGGEHRAVYVYQLESYRYWEQQLGRTDFTYGQFGENFTVDGLADDEVCIGDRYRIGGATFEVTQPRVTCFRLGIRMDEARMPSLLVAHHRPGFYLRVLEEGQVQAGDDVVRLQSGPEQLTVADVDGLLYLPNRSRRMLERALGIPALSEGWKGSFRTLLEQGEPATGTPAPPAWQGFEPLTVTEIRRESRTIASFTLTPTPPEPAAPGAVSPGQYLTVRLRPHGPDQPAVIRSYSLSTIAGRDGYRVSVKHEPHGIGSSFLHEHIRVGDTIEAAAPRGAFTLRDGERPVVLASGGVGATPVLAMLHTLADAETTREVWWVHGARDGQEHAFGAEVDRLLAALPHAHRLVSYSRPGPGETPGTAFDLVGRVSIQTMAGAGVPVDADYYVCGPDAFMQSLSAALIARGTVPEHVAMEVFGAKAVIVAPGLEGEHPPPHAPAGPPGDGPPVTFSRSNLTLRWDPGYGNLLEFAEACDIPVSFGCRIGVCHYCETGLLTGEVAYATEPLEPPDGEHVLLCCSRPTGEVTLEL